MGFGPCLICQYTDSDMIWRPGLFFEYNEAQKISHEPYNMSYRDLRYHNSGLRISNACHTPLTPLTPHNVASKRKVQQCENAIIDFPRDNTNAIEKRGSLKVLGRWFLKLRCNKPAPNSGLDLFHWISLMVLYLPQSCMKDLIHLI